MIVVRDFDQRDVAAANALTNWYIEHTAVHFALSPATEEAFEDAWRRGRVSHPWLAAELDGRFAGYAKASVWRERSAYSQTCETGIYIARGMEGKGVGKALYGELLPRLKAAGFHTVIAGMTMPNPASVALHESVGFQPVGVFGQVGRKFDRWHDVGFWSLQISD
jgi:phosphinothricin acetyltransferase